MSHEYLKAEVSGGQAGLALGAGFLTTAPLTLHRAAAGEGTLWETEGDLRPLGPMRRETIQRSPRPHPQYGSRSTDGETDSERAVGPSQGPAAGLPQSWDESLTGDLSLCSLQCP